MLLHKGMSLPVLKLGNNFYKKGDKADASNDD